MRDNADMKKLLISALALTMVFIFLSACSTTGNYPGIIEADANKVENCKLLGSFTESVDPGKIFQSIEILRCKNEVVKRATGIGVTHIVWVYKGKTGAGLQAYKCRP